MIEIEFRGKRLDNCEWLYGDLMHDNQGGCYVYPIDAENLYTENKVNQDTVGQYTGMKDKNGVGIYEGDIVRYNDNSDADYIRYGDVEDVAFIDGCFYPVSETWCQDIEVIGNKYDNPDLLTK